MGAKDPPDKTTAGHKEPQAPEDSLYLSIDGLLHPRKQEPGKIESYKGKSIDNILEQVMREKWCLPSSTEDLPASSIIPITEKETSSRRLQRMADTIRRVRPPMMDKPKTNDTKTLTSAEEDKSIQSSAKEMIPGVHDKSWLAATREMIPEVQDKPRLATTSEMIPEARDKSRLPTTSEMIPGIQDKARLTTTRRLTSSGRQVAVTVTEAGSSASDHHAPVMGNDSTKKRVSIKGTSFTDFSYAQKIPRFPEETVSMVLKIIQGIFKESLQVLKVCPQLELPHYLDKALAILEYEFITAAEKKDDYYTLLLRILGDKILEIEEPSEEGENAAWEHIHLQPAEIVVLNQQPCRIFYFFFRYISVLMFSLKEVLKSEHKAQFAHAFIQILDAIPGPFLSEPGKKCDLQSIFEYCRKHTLRAKISCPCHVPLPGGDVKE